MSPRPRPSTEPREARLMRVGELARAVGKTVRAMHLYEELQLLEPAARSDGGFRLYGPEAIDRIHWIAKLQAIGFTLGEIQGFVSDFRDAGTGRAATDRARLVFGEKLAQVREQMTQLKVIENDLLEAVQYLDSCQSCSTDFTPSECGVCGHHGHSRGDAPNLFVGLSRERGDGTTHAHAKDTTCGEARPFDVSVEQLRRDGN